jgi:chitin disaccharide deacetylase
MVLTPFAPAVLAGAPATLGIGLHAVLDPALDEASARDELLRQLERFEELRGAPPTHLDSHKHAHARPAILAAVAQVAAARRLPVRAMDAELRAALRGRGVVTTDAFLGDAARRPAWTEAALVEALRAVPAGLTELMAHPGFRPSVARTSFGAEREVELAALTGRAARAAVDAAGIRLCTWAQAMT